LSRAPCRKSYFLGLPLTAANFVFASLPFGLLCPHFPGGKTSMRNIFVGVCPRADASPVCCRTFSLVPLISPLTHIPFFCSTALSPVRFFPVIFSFFLVTVSRPWGPSCETCRSLWPHSKVPTLLRGTPQFLFPLL